jgi:Uma2 family endonuclease
VLVEVTSDSSEAYDTGLKLEAYRTIPSLETYILVSHRERRITVHHRESDGRWTTTSAIRGGAADVRSLGTTLMVDEVYRASSIR